MQFITQTDTITIVGIALRTNNRDAMTSIALHWKTFFEQQLLSTIPNKRSDDIYAVYTDFDRIPQNATEIYDLSYTLLIGAAVSHVDNLPNNMQSIVIAPAKRAVFDVLPASFDQVGAAWQHIWQMTPLQLPRIFAPDYEHYAVNGDIQILISVAQ